MRMLFLMMMILCASCASDSSKHTAADTTYMGDQLDCVAKSKTKAESEACRTEVRKEWKLDAGADR